MSKFDAVILAGAPAGSDFYPENGEISRAMVPIGNKTMLQWVIDALRGSDKIGKVVAIGNVDGNGLDLVLAPGESLVKNIRKGVEALDTNEPVLIVSSDIPLITAEAIDDFLSRAERLNADLAYPVLPKTHCEKQYPQFKRTYVKTAEGTFTGGNIMLVRPDFLIKKLGNNIQMPMLPGNKYFV